MSGVRIQTRLHLPKKSKCKDIISKVAVGGVVGATCGIGFAAGIAGLYYFTDTSNTAQCNFLESFTKETVGCIFTRIENVALSCWNETNAYSRGNHRYYPNGHFGIHCDNQTLENNLISEAIRQASDRGFKFLLSQSYTFITIMASIGTSLGMCIGITYTKSGDENIVSETKAKTPIAVMSWKDRIQHRLTHFFHPVPESSSSPRIDDNYQPLTP